MPDSSHSGNDTQTLLALWTKYEDVAMHFNDLVMRLRLQSIAGIAAVSTLVGLFKGGGVANVYMDWLVATGIFAAMAFFWVAIFCLDYFYYNRLLLGAIEAILELEKKSNACDIKITLSTKIEEKFHSPILRRTPPRMIGVGLFYLIVFAVIVAGAFFCSRHL